jgi:pyridoxal phosphate enzyme (YggS family)
MISNEDLTANLEDVRHRISAACERAGRSFDAVALLPVTKTHSPELIERLWALGFQGFGENRVQELRDKEEHFAAHATVRPRWHFIGSLQRNKVKHIVRLPLALLHAIDSVALAQEIAERAALEGQTMEGLLEVNVSGEEAKHGFTPEEVADALHEIQPLENLHVTGLMTMAPFEAEPEDTRPVFRGLRELRDRLQEELDCSLPVLSMGMSNDFEVAIEEGATLVRLGTVLLGPRETR